MAKMVGKMKNFMADKVAHVEKPDADLTWVSIKDVSRDSVLLESDVIISNPYDHDLPVCEISYGMFSNNREIVSGKIPDPGSVKANDKTAMKIPARVPYNVLLTIIKDVGSDWDLDYEMKVGLTVDIPVLGNFTIPLSKKGSLKLPTLKDLIT